jgi:hypothetical protein
MPQANQKELNKAFINTIYSWIRYFKSTKVYSKILEDLLTYGTNLTLEDKNKLLAAIKRRFNNCPEIMHPGKEAIIQIITLIEKA